MHFLAIYIIHRCFEQINSRAQRCSLVPGLLVGGGVWVRDKKEGLPPWLAADQPTTHANRAMASASWTEAEGGYTFHPRCGNLARISNGGRTAERRRPFSEFNNAVTIGSTPLKEGLAFEVRVEKKVTTWSGSILLGESFQ